MRIPLFFASLATLFAAGGAHAQQAPSGNWFGYGERGEVIVMTVKGRVGLTIGCSRGALTLALVDRAGRGEKLTPGEPFAVSFRADGGRAIEASGTARNERALDIAPPAPIVREIAIARRVVFQMKRGDGRAFMRDYAVAGAPIAIAEIAKSCAI